MIISSEITGKTYESVEACIADEREFKAKERAEKEAAKKKKEELDKAYEEAIAACDRYLKLAGIDIDKKIDEFDLIDRLFNGSIRPLF